MSILEILRRDYPTVPVTSIDENLPVSWESMNEETLAHLIFHGTKQKTNDPNGAKTLTDSEKKGNSLKVLDSLQNNEFRVSSGRVSDPFEAEVMRLAVVAVSNAILAKGGKLKDYKMADLRKRAQEALDTREAFLAKIHADANRNLAEKHELAELAGDI